jgi:ADP-heptose:LPS heptosyltransferase
MNRLKGIIYDCIGWLATIGFRKKTAVKKALIVRADEIGDFMLWHVFIEHIVTAEKFRDYEFHFCGNQSTRSLFNTFDTQWIGHTYWMEKIRFKTKILYRYRFLKNIYRQNFAVVINPTFSRDRRYDDSIVKAAKAPQTLGMRANLESTYDFETGYDKGLYTTLFDHPEKPLFEFYRNKFFTEFITEAKTQVQDTRVQEDRLPALPVDLPQKYFVIFPGSRSKKRIWPTESFIRVSDYLFDTTGATAVVCGTNNDAEYIDAFCDQYKHPCINLMGKTSLTEMLTVFSGAICLLSVDTGSVHLAAAVNCTVFGIFNGSQYKRFAPYPKELAANFHAIYPDNIEAELNDPAIVKEKYEFVVDVPYASVPAEKVIHAVYVIVRNEAI